MDAERRRGLVHLSVVWLVWGSTFLAIRVAVRGDHGLPPFALSAIRVLAGGALLLGAAAVMRAPVLPPRRLVPDLAASGVLLWTFGHAALLWGTQRAGSGTAAILFGTTPLFTLLFSIALGRRRADMRLLLGMLAGFAGIVILALPGLVGASASAVPVALILAPIGWAAGSVVQSLRAGGLHVLTSAAWQQLFGGIACALLALLTGERVPPLDAETTLAVAYLVVPGCIPAFTSYVRALQLLPTNLVMSFAYVNPVIAVLLGWQLLDEPITGAMLAAVALIAGGIVGVFRAEAQG